MTMLIGNTTLAGADAGAATKNRICGQARNAVASGTPYKIRVYVRGAHSAGRVIKAAIYDQAMTTLLAETAEWTASGTGSVGWVELLVTGSPSALTSGTQYRPMVWYGDGSISYDVVQLDKNTDVGTIYATYAYGSWPASLTLGGWLPNDCPAVDVQNAAGVSLFPQVIMVL